LGHYISLGITGALMLALNIYMLHCAFKKRKKLPHFKKFGPFYFTVVAAFFILADIIRHVLQDTDVWPAPGSNEYRPECAQTTSQENIKCLSLVGWIFTIFFTWSGFVLLFIGTMWNANLISKLKQVRQQWKKLRS